ncbi:MarR family winged helix-turn-helix transcriptional regulator [Promicromonospora sp. AC04]|uniref:MarR family winged helix-turn-helix transcriptional regulator n=1 Tax=Promicromonospora sp. AC04 TaxID=2135723 RepID=UPI000D3ADE2B|nr:MarR family winged helix-turn-helix transcriptional regulator [Promicromonospora sp. AC04]
MTDQLIQRGLAQSRRLARLIVLLADRSREEFAVAIAPFGLPVPVARTLMVLSGPTPMNEMAGHLGYDPSYVTGLADQLEQRGLATRVPGKDRRIKMLQPTAEGHALRTRIMHAVDAAGAFAQSLSPAERDTLGELLERLLDPTATK